MRERDESDYELCDLAMRCRRLAESVKDVRAAQALLNLAGEYDAAIKARSELKEFGWKAILTPSVRPVRHGRRGGSI